jgi:hypothetical protein
MRAQLRRFVSMGGPLRPLVPAVRAFAATFVLMSGTSTGYPR